MKSFVFENIGERFMSDGSAIGKCVIGEESVQVGAWSMRNVVADLSEIQVMCQPNMLNRSSDWVVEPVLNFVENKGKIRTRWKCEDSW